MAIERLPRRRLYHEIYRSASAYGSAFPVGTVISACYKNEKEARLQGIVLTGPQQMRFNVVVRDQVGPWVYGTNAFVRKRYLLQDPGMILDSRNWPDSLLTWGGKKEICVMMGLSGNPVSAQLYTADLELLELMG